MDYFIYIWIQACAIVIQGSRLSLEPHFNGVCGLTVHLLYHRPVIIGTQNCSQCPVDKYSEIEYIIISLIILKYIRYIN